MNKACTFGCFKEIECHRPPHTHPCYPDVQLRRASSYNDCVAELLQRPAEPEHPQEGHQNEGCGTPSGPVKRIGNARPLALRSHLPLKFREELLGLP